MWKASSLIITPAPALRRSMRVISTQCIDMQSSPMGNWHSIVAACPMGSLSRFQLQNSSSAFYSKLYNHSEANYGLNNGSASRAPMGATSTMISNKSLLFQRTLVRSHSGLPSSGKPVEKFKESKERDLQRILKSLLAYTWPADRPEVKRRVIGSLGLLVASKLMNVSVPYLFKGIVDSLVVAGVSPYILAPGALVLLYGTARAGAAIFNELRNAVFAKVSQSSTRILALEIFNHLHKLDLSFHLSRKTGGLSSVIDRGKRGVNFILSSLVFNVVPTVFELGVVCSLLYVNMGPEFAFTAFAAVFAYTVFTTYTTRWRTQFRKDMNREESEASQKVIDSLINYETVKYFGNEEHEARRYENHLRKYEASSLKTQHSLAFLNAGQSFIFSVALTAIMYMTLGGIEAGTMTVGDMVMVNGLLFQLSIPLNFLGTVYREISQAMTDMENMFGLIDTKSKVKDDEHAPPLQITEGTIEFKDVHFSYDPQRPILNGISFVAPAGSTIGIVGPSGSGKSTVLRLLFRFFDVSSGSILIDGQDISKVNLKSLREKIGVVPQDTILFNETLGYNIRYGNLDATDEEVEEAIDRAMLRELVNRLPNGLNTQCGERGLMLSGGEKQRVALARSILKRPKILLCDESTSSLDTQTERKIMESIQEVSKGCTTITIAHRLSTVKDADQILVFGVDGRIAERGTHEELISKQGLYYELWMKQMQSPETTVEENFSDAKTAK